MIPGLSTSLCIYLTTKEKPGKSWLRGRLKAVQSFIVSNVASFLQMSSGGLHKLRHKEGEMERGEGKFSFLLHCFRLSRAMCYG